MLTEKVYRMVARASTARKQSRGRSGGGRLEAAHRGYAYQDLVAAYLLVLCLVKQYQSIVIDRKVVDDDRFDDIEINAGGVRTRRQLKFSDDADSAVEFSDFNRVGSSLRIDRLVSTFTAEGQNAADEYRLCVTWQAPGPSDSVASILVPSVDPPTFEGYATRTFRLDPESLWPLAGEPRFKPLDQCHMGASSVTRDDVIGFCERFVVEVGLPSASLDLGAPGALERLLLTLLADQIGIGRYPNGDRHIEDVAALAIHTATTARTAGATLSPIDVARRLELRTDFGRVAQTFPLDRSVLQERLPLRRRLRDAIANGGVHLVLAGPGAGKSWTLTQLAEDLEGEGVAVARHYCFLEPGDELVERRVTTDVFFGNLLGDLRDAFKAHSYPPPQVFAAGLGELESFLWKASNDGQDIVVIVDGLDHIARVRDASAGLSDNETDIVERLSTLSLPPLVTLVVGSQPGVHLDPLREAFGDRIAEHAIEPWSMDEILGLAKILGVDTALDEVHLLEAERRAALFEHLVERSEGNPLYAHYLCRGLVEAILAGEIVDPQEWLQATPAILGDIANYYQHLYQSASSQAQAIADILGVLDFSVTEAELREIAQGPLEDWVPAALRALSPILTRATAQGGLRIFHESFRRYMLQELEGSGRRLANVLSPVVTWLESRNFFADAKSYRFTLPVMRRAGRPTEILQRVSSNFVLESIQNGHPHDAIERNLALAADVATRTLDWPALVRCSELSRALEACFEEGSNNLEEYWQTYEAIFGAQAVAERLLFDGRPTQSREQGLLACEIVDIAGVTAPWQEYLSLPFTPQEEFSSHEFDPLGSLLETEKIGLATIRGRLRIGQVLRELRRIHRHLFDPEAEITSLFVRKLGKLLSEEVSPNFVEAIVLRADFQPPKRYVLPKRVACALLLGLSDAASEAGKNPSGIRFATGALRYASTSIEAIWCVECGAHSDQGITISKPLASIDIALDGDHPTVNAQFVREWVATVRLHAHQSSTSASLLGQRQRAQGSGWYRCWLRFVIECAKAEAAAANNCPYEINEVFSELVVDARPFEGKPRACDLYSIQSLIGDSLVRAMALLRSPEEWQLAIDSISRARSGTSTRLDREDGGPITAGSFFSLLMPYASTQNAFELIAEALEQGIKDEEEDGTYYSHHAEFRMKLARLHALASNRGRALEHWREASKFLLGYGFHKDIALFGVIDSAPTLLKFSEQAAISALVRLQPLLSAVLRHTDRRSTKHTPNAWFRSILEVNAVRAIELLSRDFIRELGAVSWMSLTALKDTLRHLRDIADPLLLDALWATVLFEIEYENEGKEVAEERLGPIGRMLESHPNYAKTRFVRLCAEAFDDPRHYREPAVARLREFAQQYGLTLPSTTEIKESRGKDPHRDAASINESPKVEPTQFPRFKESTRFVDVLGILRKLSNERLPREQVEEVVTVPLSHILMKMMDRGEEARAHRLLHFFVHETPFWSIEGLHPVGSLAKHLDNAGQVSLATVAYALTFTSSRGGGGWLSFGDQTHAHVLHRAMELDKNLAQMTVASEAARKLTSGGFNGIAQHLIEQVSAWGNHELAARAWEEAFTIIESRLPLPGRRSVFVPFDGCEPIDWSLDEALATLLLTRIGDVALPRKMNALSGFAQLLLDRPNLFRKPLGWLLTRDITVSTTQIILQAMVNTPTDISVLIESLEELVKGYARGDAWSLSLLAEKLLLKTGRPFHVCRSRPMALHAAPTHRGRMLTSYGDVGGVLEELQELWPKLPALVTSRMDLPDVDNDRSREYAKERMKLTYGRRENTQAPAPVLSWPTEILTSVLDDVLMGLYEHLWRQGEWDPDLEDFVSNLVLPDLQLHLAMDASRVPRPNWPLAREAQNQLTNIVRVPSDDPTFGDWVRLALHEQTYFRSDGRDYLATDRFIRQSAAIVRTDMGGSVPEGATALRPGDCAPWWCEASPQELSVEARSPQLIQIAFKADWLGKISVLVPPMALRHRAHLRPPASGAPLRWHDSRGQVAVVLRTWRVRGDRLNSEWHSTLGADLIMHPELLDTLLRVYGGPLKELQNVYEKRLDIGEE